MTRNLALRGWGRDYIAYIRCKLSFALLRSTIPYVHTYVGYAPQAVMFTKQTNRPCHGGIEHFSVSIFIHLFLLTHMHSFSALYMTLHFSPSKNKCLPHAHMHKVCLKKFPRFARTGDQHYATLCTAFGSV